MSRTCGSDEKGQILVLAALLLAFLFIPLSVFVIDTGLVEAGYAQLNETVQAASEDGASMLNADLYRSSHGQSIELDPALARQVTDRALVVSHLPGLTSWQIEVQGSTVTVTANLTVRLFALGGASLRTKKSARLSYGP
jgi:hypothetical protein